MAGVIETFCLNGKVGDIGIKDKTIEIKLVFPNDVRTEDELMFLYPIKRSGLATVRIFKAVNREYVPGRRRSDRDEVGTPLLPGVDVHEECHGCGKMVDTVNQPFYVKPVDKPGEKEAILCDICFMVPQPETIKPPAEPDKGNGADTADIPKEKVCGNCGHPYPEQYEGQRDPGGGDLDETDSTLPVHWVTVENDEGIFERCPACETLNDFLAQEDAGEGNPEGESAEPEAEAGDQGDPTGDQKEG